MKFLIHIKALFNYGKALWFFSGRNFDVSKRYFNTILELNPKINPFYFECYKYLAIIGCYQKNFEEAKMAFNKAEEVEKVLTQKNKAKKFFDSEYYYFKGYLCEVWGDTENAKKFYQLAVQMRKPTDITNVNFIQNRLKVISENERIGQG